MVMKYLPQGLDVGLSWLKTLGVGYRSGKVILENCAKKYLGSWRRQTTIPPVNYHYSLPWRLGWANIRLERGSAF